MLCKFPVLAFHLLDQERDIEGQIRVGGRSMFLVMGRLGSYSDPTGLAAARMEVRALRVVMMPALAMETVCCS